MIIDCKDKRVSEMSDEKQKKYEMYETMADLNIDSIKGNGKSNGKNNKPKKRMIKVDSLDAGTGEISVKDVAVKKFVTIKEDAKCFFAFTLCLYVKDCLDYFKANGKKFPVEPEELIEAVVNHVKDTGCDETLAPFVASLVDKIHVENSIDEESAKVKAIKDRISKLFKSDDEKDSEPYMVVIVSTYIQFLRVLVVLMCNILLEKKCSIDRNLCMATMRMAYTCVKSCGMDAIYEMSEYICELIGQYVEQMCPTPIKKPRSPTSKSKATASTPKKRGTAKVATSTKTTKGKAKKTATKSTARSKKQPERSIAEAVDEENDETGDDFESDAVNNTNEDSDDCGDGFNAVSNELGN